AGLGHHFGLEISAVHGLEIGDDGRFWKALSKRPYAVHSFRNDQWRAGFKPVDAGVHRHLRSGECFGDVNDIQRDLDNRLHSRSIGRAEDDCQLVAGLEGSVVSVGTSSDESSCTSEVAPISLNILFAS